MRIHLCLAGFFLVGLAFPVFAQEVTHIPQALFEPGSVGLGAGIRLQDSPYKQEGSREDLVPLYLMETEYVFAYGTYGGVHVLNNEKFQLDILAQYRFNRLTPEDSPFLRGMAKRKQSVDAGALPHL